MNNYFGEPFISRQNGFHLQNDYDEVIINDYLYRSTDYFYDLNNIKFNCPKFNKTNSEEYKNNNKIPLISKNLTF